MINTALINGSRINTNGRVASLVASLLSAGAVVTYNCVLAGVVGGVPSVPNSRVNTNQINAAGRGVSTLPDLPLPIASAQIRKKSGEQTFVSVVVPNGVSTIAAIQARSGGQIIVTRRQRNLDGVVIIGEVARATVDQINYTRGARSSSVVIQGHTLTVNTATAIRPLRNVSIDNLTNGLRRVRAEIDHTVTGGDTARHGDADFLVSEVAVNISPGNSTMDVSE